MDRIWRFLKILLRAAIFFALFAFALNNAQPATVHLFFGAQWVAPMVLVVLLAFAAGVAVGVLGVLPRLLRRKNAPPGPSDAPESSAPPGATARTAQAVPDSSGA